MHARSARPAIRQIAAALALALTIPLAACGTRGAAATQTTTNVITVSATSTIKAVPDVARISVGITTTGNSAKAAQKANAKPTNAVIAQLKELGVAEEEIQTTYTNLSPVWNESGETDTYEMRTVLSVGGLAIDQVSTTMDACVDAGATEVDGPEYYISSYDERYAEALAQAVEATKPKAEVLAKASGVRLGGVVSVTEGYQDSSIAFAKASGAVMADEAAEELASIEPGQVSIQADVTVSYEIR